MIAVLTGLDVSLEEKCARLKNQRVGLLSNPTGVTRDLKQNVDALRAADVNVVALFSPEHGFSAAARAGEHVASGRDERTGLPIHSLYGETRRPTREMLADLDVLIFDLQDVGARFYTYTTTLALVLEACAENKKRLIVLDHPNAINGNVIEGPILESTLQTFVGHGAAPIRFGMTLGELARFYNCELNINAELDIVPLRGWSRVMWYDETNLTWVPPSPNMPHLASATIYPGTCLLEGTNLSVGRGTTLPFEIVGAPFVDGYALADSLNALRLDGVLFRPLAFTPNADHFANEKCFGVQIHVTDRETFRPVTMALHLLSSLCAQYAGKFAWREQAFDRLIGKGDVREKIDRGVSVSEIMNAWEGELREFRRRRDSYLMYS